jgi:hypothetical protein
MHVHDGPLQEVAWYLVSSHARSCRVCAQAKKFVEDVRVIQTRRIGSSKPESAVVPSSTQRPSVGGGTNPVINQDQGCRSRGDVATGTIRTITIGAW